MRVAMISEHASPLAVLGGVDAGGQNVHVAALSRGMGARGVEVRVYTRRDDADIDREVTFAPNVTVVHVDAGPAEQVPKDDLFPFMDAFADEVRADWDSWMPDLVHTHFWMSGYAGMKASWSTRVPLVHTFHALGVVKRRHQGEKDTSPVERMPVEQSLVRNADHIVATCSDEVFELRHLGGDLEHISVVPCGVDLDLFTPEGEVEPRSEGLHRIVVVSRLVERKGIDTVIRALRDVPRAELHIAGGPPLDDLESDPEVRRLMAVADEEGVRDRVVFRGRLEREEVPPLLRSADVVVTTPWYEPFGIVPLEAMACGVPVVAAAVGGIIDTVVDGLTGLHVPPRDPPALADGLNHLLNDPQLRIGYGREGARRARHRYSWNRVVEMTLHAYDTVLDRHMTIPEADALMHGEVR